MNEKKPCQKTIFRLKYEAFLKFKMKKHKILRLYEFRYEIMRILGRVDSQTKLPIQTNVLVPYLQKSVHAIKKYDQNKSCSNYLNTLYNNVIFGQFLVSKKIFVHRKKCAFR